MANVTKAVGISTVTVVQQPESVILHLKKEEKHVSWEEGTEDNELLNKKKSKSNKIFIVS